MNVFVCVKQVPDTESKIVLKGAAGIEEAGIKWILNPYDELAVEEALKLKDKAPDTNVVVVTLGPERATEALRLALSMGADRGIHIVHRESLDHDLVAQALAKAIKAAGPAPLVFAGKQAIDDDAAQVPYRLAHYLEAAVATKVTAFELKGELVAVAREGEGGAVERAELPMPCVVSASRGLNSPRYPTVPNIMKAKKKEIRSLTLKDLGLEGAVSREQVVSLTLPADKPEGKVLKGEAGQVAPQLADLLHTEAKIL